MKRRRRRRRTRKNFMKTVLRMSMMMMRRRRRMGKKAGKIIIIIRIIMKIIYIAPNPLKSSRRFTKSVTATLHYRSGTIKYTHSSCILMNQNKLKYKDGT